MKNKIKKTTQRSVPVGAGLAAGHVLASFLPLINFSPLAILYLWAGAWAGIFCYAEEKEKKG